MGARFFGAVENGDSAGAFRQRLQQMGGREGTIEANFQDTDFFATAQQLVHDFFTGADRRAHNYNHPFCLRMAIKLERFILTPGRDGEIVHRRFNVVINRVVPGVRGFAGLEISIRVRRSTADHRMFRIQRA